MRDDKMNLGEYHQMIYLNSSSIDEFLRWLHQEFLGVALDFEAQVVKEFM